MLNFSVPSINYNIALQASANPFRDRFGQLSDDEWREILLLSAKQSLIEGIEFPAIPDQELQLRIHGSASYSTSIKEAFAFYSFVKSNFDRRFSSGQRFLDFGCGWGRISRPFMRDFDLKDMYGFEPDLLFCAIARSLNPYICVLSGEFLPNGSNSHELVRLHSRMVNILASLRTFRTSMASRTSVGIKAWRNECLHDLGRPILKELQIEQQQLEEGSDIHWYSKLCISAAGSIDDRLKEYDAGEFVWFTNGSSKLYGEAFLNHATLQRLISQGGLPLAIVTFDAVSLAQDAFVLKRV